MDAASITGSHDPGTAGGIKIGIPPPSPPLSSVSEDYQTFEIHNVATSSPATPALSQEILLLAWLIVISRTRDIENVRFEWAYMDRTSQNGSNSPHPHRLSMNEIIPSLDASISVALEAIQSFLSRDQTHNASANSITLSTDTLLRTSNGVDEEGNLHLEVCYHGTLMSVKKVWHSETSLGFAAERNIRSLADSVQDIVSQPHVTIQSCINASMWDLDAIWKWNHELPTMYTFCMHDRISQEAQRLADKVTIHSWDGCLTYSQVDGYSTRIAHRLHESGVQMHDVVPICFEKSRWTVVAVLAVMKAGATIALMDPALPLARLQNMAMQVSAKAIVSSRSQLDFSTNILPGKAVFIVEENAFVNLEPASEVSKLPAVPPSAVMYMIFTSGSTGTPKGVQISHSTYSSSAIPRAAAVGYTESSRVLDFASDVSIDSMLLTLANGGCLCIPSDDDRLNDINGVIQRMKISYAGITPTMARILDEEVISSLNALGLGGEAVSTGDCSRYGRLTRIVIGYGPCECTIGCTINENAATGRNYISIGPGNGACMWIVDPDDHERLMPVGAVGELLVEGPIVGQGYLNDPDKTAAAFIEDPQWLISGHDTHPGRRGRLYKTGDLGKYDPDGSGGIVFVGRKDTQVKLRGQRVELGEIESQLNIRLPSDVLAIAEVLNTSGHPSLVAFVALQSKNSNGSATELALWRPTAELERMLSGLSADLAEVLPKYMVPTVYIPITAIPVLISSKIDRKQLRQFGATLDLRKLEDYPIQDPSNGRKSGIRESHNRLWSDQETLLRSMWSQTLNVDESAIDLQDNFFVLGGDSVLAMKLVATCKAQNLWLSVADVFRHSTLSAMARIIKPNGYERRPQEFPPFDMLSTDILRAVHEAAQICGTGVTAIEDIYPCTATQEGLFTFSLKSEELYIAQRIAQIPAHINLYDWRKAWNDVVAVLPILRTRVIQLQGEATFQQVVLKEDVSWSYAPDLESYLAKDRSDRMELGEPLARYAVVENSSDGSQVMVWSVHHILYDGWSEPLILEKVYQALSKQPFETGRLIREFVTHLRQRDSAAQQSFWCQELAGATGPQFPSLPSRDYFPTSNGFVERQVHIKPVTGFPFTMATVLRAAWALVASQYTLRDDVVFGETLNGRDIDFDDVESTIGPLNATIPIRVQIDRTNSVQAYLQSIQVCMSARASHQHMGFQYIRKVSRDAQHACEAPVGLVTNAEVESEADDAGSKLGFERVDILRENLHFNPYPLMLAFGLRKDGFRVCASFDTDVVSSSHMSRVLAQVERAFEVMLLGDLSQTVADVDCLPSDGRNQIWSRNSVAPLSLELSSGKLRADADARSGSVYPPAVVQWVCDPRNPSLLSPLESVGELWLESSFASNNTSDAPSWLLAGSKSSVGRNSKLQSTGDLVRLNENGSLTFVQRTESNSANGDMVPIATQCQGDVASQRTSELTPGEEILRSVWGSLLGLQASEIGFDDNFFRMGGDSVMAMKLVSMLRTQGYTLTVAEVFKHMRLSDAARVMRPNRTNIPQTPVYEPFASLDHVDIRWFKTNIILPQLEDASWTIKDVCPVTHMQAIDIEATICKPRTSVQYTLLFFEAVVDVTRLKQACSALIKSHDILRTLFVQSGSGMMQVILEEMTTPFLVIDSEDEVVMNAATKLCEKDVEEDISLGSPFLKMFLLSDAGGRQCLILRLSHAQYDGESLPRILGDLESLYRGKAYSEIEQFPRYIARSNSPVLQREATDYWQRLLIDSTISMLPGSTGYQSDKGVFRSQLVDFLHTPNGITTASLLSTAWALVLARELKSNDVVFGAVSSGRSFDDNLDLSIVSGPCYQIMPVRVHFGARWKAMDLLQHVQTQIVQSSKYDFLGFRKISDQCTRWPSEAKFFNSIVHHQDVIENVDYLPFEKSQCKVDVLKPHGDAACPLKIVSYIRAGHTYIGIVSSETAVIFMDAMLAKMVDAIYELAKPHSASVSLAPYHE